MGDVITNANWLVIGVDPGKFGAIVGVGKAGVVFAEPVPLIGKQAKKTEYDYHRVRALIDPAGWMANGYTITGISIEMPPAFMFIKKPTGESQMMPAKTITRELAYVVMGMAIAWKIPYAPVTPLMWQKNVLEGFNRGDKTMAIAHVQRKYPLFDIHAVGNKQVRTGVADAICLCDYWLEKNAPF